METRIVPPEGYEIDKENSTFECIKYRRIKSKPLKWEEFGAVTGYYVSDDSNVRNALLAEAISINRNVFPKKEEAEAMLAMAQLCQLRDAWNEGWTPNWKDNINKYSISVRDGELEESFCVSINRLMTFKTEKLRDEFLDTFRDLLEIAKPFL